MNKACLILIAVLLVLPIITKAPEITATKTDYLKYVSSEVDIDHACSEYQLCNPTALTFNIASKSKSYFNWNFLETKNTLKNSWFLIKQNVTQNITWYDSVCKDYISFNVSTGKNDTLQNCTNKLNWLLNTSEVWSSYNPIGSSIAANRCYDIKICGSYGLATYDNPVAIDNTLDVAGYSYPEYAWWNNSWTYCRNITVSNPQANYPAYINITNTTNMFANRTDIRFVNTYCNNGGSVLSWDLRDNSSSWFSADVLLDGTQSIISVYYNPSVSTASTSNYQTTWDNRQSSMIHYTPNDEGTGNTIYDIVNVNGLMNGTNTGADWTTGYYGSALSYVRANTDRVSLGNANDISGTNKFTIECYVNLTTKPSGTEEYNVFTKASSGSSGEWVFGVAYAASQLRVDVRGAGWCGELLSGSLNANQWYHVAATYDGTNTTLYLNGTQIGTKNCSQTIGSTSDVNYMGAFLTTTHNMNGLIDECKMFNKNLNSTEIGNHYAITRPTFSVGSETTNSTPSAAPTLTTLTINGASSNATHSYTPSTPDNFTASVNVTGLWVAIVSNGTLLSNGTTSTTTSIANGVGFYNITAYYAGNATYSGSSATYWLTITQAANPMTFCIQNSTAEYCNLIVNGGFYSLSSTGSYYETYPTPIKSRWGCSGGGYTITRNGTDITSENNTWVTVRAGTGSDNEYDLTCTGNQNYTGNLTREGVGINKGIPNINVTFNTSSAVAAGTPVLVTCNKPAEITAYNLYKDNVNITNPYVFDTTGLLGNYNYTCNTTGNANYTAGSGSSILTVTSASGLSINVYDEENTTKALTFNITVNNGTASDTAYNQNNPYFNTSIIGAVTIDITSTGYQQRTYYTTLSVGSSTTINASLLSVGSGSWVIFYVYTPTELPIQNALINAERLVPPASWLTVAQKKTDSSGSAAIFLSPITTYRLNFSAAGYTNQSLQLMPAASPYVIYMMPTSALNISYNTSYKNLVIWIEPNGTALYQNTTNAFRYYILSSDNMLEFEGWRLTYSNGSTILFQNTTNAGGVTYTTNIDTTIYSSGYIDLNYWFKKAGFALVNDTHRYYIYGVIAYNTSIMAEVNDIAAGVAAGTPDVTMEQFAFISMLITIIGMAAASSQMKMFGSGVIGLMILSMLTFIGTYIWGSAYIVGWELVGLFSLGVVAAIYIRGGFG